MAQHSVGKPGIVAKLGQFEEPPPWVPRCQLGNPRCNMLPKINCPIRFGHRADP